MGPLLPAIAGVVGTAGLGSAAQLARASGSESDQAGDGFFGTSRWVGRTALIILAWGLFLSYTFLLAPGKSPPELEVDKEVLMTVLSTPFDGTVSPLFVCIFNMLGIFPALYAATLLPGASKQSPVPAFPFVAASFFLGAFALAPYLAIREYRGRGSVVIDDLDWVTRNIFESRITAIFLLASALYLTLFALGNGSIGAVLPAEAWAGFVPTFMGSLTPHASCVDFLVLWMLYSPALLEDGRRRGRFLGPPSTWETSETALFLSCAGVPIFGGCLWLLLRPSLPGAQAP